MAGVFKIKNLQDAEFTLTHPDGVGAVSIASNNIAKIDAVNAALALKANTADVNTKLGKTDKAADSNLLDGYNLDANGVPLFRGFHEDGRQAIVGNLNTIAVNSIYNCADNATGTPLAQWGFVHTMVHANSPNWRTQMWYPMQNNSGTVYQRFMSDGTNWSAWNSIGVEAADVNTKLSLKANTADLKEIGVGQTWQNVTANRIAGVTYTNTTGKPIVVSAYTFAAGGDTGTQVLYVDGLAVSQSQYYVGTTASGTRQVLGIVPSGSKYSVNSFGYWFELR